MLNESAPRIRTEVQVMFFDTDCAASSIILPTCASSKSRALSRGRTRARLAQMAETQKYPVVVRTEIDYRRAAKLGDKLVIEGWLDRLKRVRFWCAFKIVRPADEILIAECRQMLAIIQMPEAKLLRVPDDWDRYRADAA